MSSGPQWSSLPKELIVSILEFNGVPRFREIDQQANQLICTYIYPDILRALFKEIDPQLMRDSAIDKHIYALLSPDAVATLHPVDEMDQLPSSSTQSGYVNLEEEVAAQQEFNERCADPVFVCSRIEAVFKELMHRSKGISDLKVRTDCQQALNGLHCSVALQAMRHIENLSLIAFVEALSNRFEGTFKERVSNIKNEALGKQDATELVAHAFRMLLKEQQPMLNGIQYLDLSNCKLTSLPPEIAMLKELVILDMNRNKISRLPHELGELNNLTRLTLSNNLINQVPDEISQLTKLSELYLDSNKLDKVPAGILALNSLEILNLSSNQIAELPEAISHMKGLKELHAANNRISAFPESFGELRTLERIDARNNWIERLPESFRSLKNLHMLNLMKNRLVEYPAVLRSLPHLADLKLDRSLAQKAGSIVRMLSACALAFGSSMTAFF